MRTLATPRPATLAALLAIGLALAAPTAAATDEPPPAITMTPAAPPEAAAELRAWHRLYVVRAAPVKAALDRLLRARQEARPDRYEERVRRAARALAEAIEASPVPLPATDRAARFLLRRTYLHLAHAAAAGAAGRFEAMELELRRAGGFLREAARVLGRYGLRP